VVGAAQQLSHVGGQQIDEVMAVNAESRCPETLCDFRRGAVMTGTDARREDDDSGRIGVRPSRVGGRAHLVIRRVMTNRHGCLSLLTDDYSRGFSAAAACRPAHESAAVRM
jgi:hypothetical protein